MPLFRGVRAWIEVDGQPLPEHKVVLDSRRTTCFIPSEEGKKFSIRFQNTERTGASLRANVYLDGTYAASNIILSTEYHAAKVSGQTRWEGYESPFQFSKLRTTDDESQACQDEHRLRELGTIRVQIEWVQALRQENWHPPAMHNHNLNNQPVFERSKKASAHCISFGNLETVPRPRDWYSTHRIPFVEPTEFIFQYAPQDWLQAKDIIAPSSTPAASHKRKRETPTASTASDTLVVEGLNDEEEAIYRRLKAKLDAHQNPKRRKAIKHESCEGSNISPLIPGEVIDLTGED